MNYLNDFQPKHVLGIGGFNELFNDMFLCLSKHVSFEHKNLLL